MPAKFDPAQAQLILQSFLRNHRPARYSAAQLKENTEVAKSKIRSVLEGVNHIKTEVIDGKTYWYYQDGATSSGQAQDESS